MKTTVDIQGNVVEVSGLTCTELNADLIRKWEDLEARAIEGNAYLSPHFILPALRHLTPNANVLLVFVSHVIGDTTLLTGAGVFERTYGSRLFPFPHLKAYQCVHSYLSGLLVDGDFVDSTLTAFFRFLCSFRRSGCGVAFATRTGDTTLARRMAHVSSQLRIPWRQTGDKKRAILILNQPDGAPSSAVLAGKLKRSIRHGRNVLQRRGQRHWKVIRGREVDTHCIERFLHLEDLGWKGRAGSSLLASAHGAAFFRAMIQGFAQSGRAFFTELTVDGRCVASSSNLISGRAGYAFKIGWDPEFAAASPGVQNEMEFLQNVSELFPQLEHIDSGAEEGSFIEQLWRDKYALVSGAYVTSPLVRPMAAFIDGARRLKHRLVGDATNDAG